MVSSVVADRAPEIRSSAAKRKQAAGTWQEQSTAFMLRVGEHDAGKKKPKLKHSSGPRMSTLNELKSLCNGLWSGLNVTLDSFAIDDLLVSA
eukprot:1403074-Amphidinium_carterae.2